MRRVRAALRPDAFDDARLRRLLADVASGQPPASLLQPLEEDAKWHMDACLSSLPSGTPVCSIGVHPTCPGRWLLSRCETGALPVIMELPALQQQAEGVSAAEELEGILEDSVASMRAEGDRDTKAQKAAWWRARLALDERLKRLLLYLEACLVPWTCLLLGSPQPPSFAAAVQAAAGNAATALQGSALAGEWPPVLRQVFAAVFQAQDALEPEHLLAAARQLCRLLGQPETAAIHMAQEIRCHYPAEELRASSPSDESLSSALKGLSLDAALTDISNTVAAAPPSSGRKQAVHTAKRGRAAQQLAPSSALEEADCVARSTVAEAEAGVDSLWAEAQEEAACTLRAAPRRSTRAAAARTPALAKCMNEGAKEPSAGDSDIVEETESEEELPAVPQSAARSTRGLKLGRSRGACSSGAPHTAAVKTPAPVRAARMLAGDENAVAATPAQPTTARRGSRFAAMQTPAAAAPPPQLPPRAASRAPLTAVQPPRPRPSESAQLEEMLPAAGKRAAGRDRSRVSFAVDAPAGPMLETPSVQPRTAARKKAGVATGVKSVRKAAPLAVDLERAAGEAGGGKKDGTRSAAPFVIHRAPDLADLECEVGDLGARMRALALGGGLAGPDDESAAALEAAERGPVLLILDGELQSMPWESLPALRRHRMYRAPSLACARAIAARGTSTGGGSPDSATGSQQACSGAVMAEQLRSVDVHDAVYLLNPSGDLAATQSTFQELFQQQRGWQGTVGAPGLPGAELAAALTERQLFVYCGHGGGQQHMPPRVLRRLPRCAASLLMGCSSGRLVRAGAYDPSGPVLAYLLAGCPAAVANLWDVTDRDIDRFAMALLEKWLPEDAEEALAPDDGRDSQRSMCISSSIAQSRGVCRLPHLIGAAPVCYGIPTAVKIV